MDCDGVCGANLHLGTCFEEEDRADSEVAVWPFDLVVDCCAGNAMLGWVLHVRS